MRCRPFFAKYGKSTENVRGCYRTVLDLVGQPRQHFVTRSMSPLFHLLIVWIPRIVEVKRLSLYLDLVHAAHLEHVLDSQRSTLIKASKFVSTLNRGHGIVQVPFAGQTHQFRLVALSYFGLPCTKLSNTLGPIF